MRHLNWTVALMVTMFAGLELCSGQALSERYWSSTGLEFVLVRAGTFEMGSNDPVLDAAPIHKVTITRGYYMATTEVTFDVYDMFAKETQARKPSDFRYGRGKQPAVDMIWLYSVRFCNWLSGKDGLRPAYVIQGEQVTWVLDADGYRLPTEAEWEYAARAGPLGENFRYAGSDDPAEVAWYDDNAGLKNHPVALKKPNGIGLFDMNGNVAEYCWDWSEQYESSGNPVVDPVGPKTGTIRAVRGGSQITPSLTLPISRRAASFLNDRSGEKGFRIARSLTRDK